MIATQDDLIGLGSRGRRGTIHGLQALELGRAPFEHELDAWVGRGLAVGASAAMVLVLGALMAVEYWLVWQAVFAPWLNLLETARIW
jgi:hypothetical protein